MSRTDNHGSKRINWVKGDVLNPESYRNAIANCEIIIHAAAITHSKTASEYFSVNVEGTRNLCSAISWAKDPLFGLISSRVAEEKSGAYGESKLQAEKVVKSLKRWLIIRPSEVYGGSKSEGVEKTIRSAISGGLQLCPIGDKSKMYPIHLSDIANAIYRSTFETVETQKTLVLNGTKGYSFRELLELIRKISGKKMTVIPIPKWFLNLVGFVSRVLPMNIGFVPDQVARLYSSKTHSTGSEETVSLERYIKQLVDKKNA